MTSVWFRAQPRPRDDHSIDGIGNLLRGELTPRPAAAWPAFLSEPSRRLRPARSSAPLRQPQRKPPLTQSVQPATETRVLYLGDDQHPAERGIQGQLRPQARRRQTTKSSCRRPRPPMRQRPLGDAPRRPALPTPGQPPTLSGLANALRIERSSTSDRGSRNGRENLRLAEADPPRAPLLRPRPATHWP